MARRRRRRTRGTKGMHCVRKKRTRAGMRCAKFAGGSLGRARRRRRRRH